MYLPGWLLYRRVSMQAMLPFVCLLRWICFVLHILFGYLLCWSICDWSPPSPVSRSDPLLNKKEKAER